MKILYQNQFDYLNNLHKRWILMQPGGKSMSIKNSDLTRIDFNGLSLKWATFKKCSFKDVDFKDASLEGVLFIDCDFEGSSMVNSTVFNVTFRECHIGQDQLPPGSSINLIRSLDGSFDISVV